MTIHRIRAIAVRAGHNPSPVVEETFNVTTPATVATPTITPTPGSYTDSVSIALATATVGASIYYTLNGSTPSAVTGTLYTGAFALTFSATVKAIAVKAGMTDSGVATADYTLVPGQAAAPSISPSAGTYADSVLVSMSTVTEDAVIYYTLDGSTPSISSTVYSTPFTLTSSTTVRAIAANAGGTASTITTVTYTVTVGPPPGEQVATPVFSPAAGFYTATVQVSISTATSGATIHYTTDGTIPTTASPVYSAPFAVSVTRTVKALGVKAGLADSVVASATYTLVVATPVVTPAGGTFANFAVVTLTCATTGASIYYEFLSAGSPQPNSGTLYTGPFKVYRTTGSFALKVRAFKTGMTASATRTTSFTITKPPASGPATYTIPLSIDKTGATDVTMDLVDFIENVPDGLDGAPNTIVFQANGLYAMQWTLQIHRRKNLIFEGNGAQLWAKQTTPATVTPSNINFEHASYSTSWPRTREHFVPMFSKGITIRNLGILGPKPAGDPFVAAWEGQHAFEFTACVDIEMDGCFCNGVWGDGIGWRQGGSGAGDFWWNQNFYIHDSNFQNMGRQGLVPNAIYNCLIEDCTWSNIKRSWIDIECVSDYPGQGCINFTVRRTVANGIQNTFFTNGGFSHGCGGIVVEDVTSDSVMNVLVPYAKWFPRWWHYIYNPPTETNYRSATRTDFDRRGSYSFIRVRGGGGLGSPQPVIRAEGANAITVIDCVQDKSAADPGPFVRANENAVINISGNTGTNITAQYVTWPDPSLTGEEETSPEGGSNRLHDGIEAIPGPGNPPNPPWVPGSYRAELFFDSPVPTGPPTSLPYVNFPPAR